MVQPRPLCHWCRHYLGRDAACTVYPEGIPKPIWKHIADHREPYDGDGGVRFEPREDLTAEQVAERLAFEDEMRRRFGLPPVGG